jgi:glycosyltransferase involved in cell wall biosynthesis
MRICLVYDCLYPYTVGGAERWYRNLGLRLAADGHEVTYLTLRQWERGELPDLPGVRVVEAGPRMALYARAGQRRILPPLAFGAGVLLHLLRHGGRYDVVHTASFPYFSLLAAAVARRLHRFRLVVDWHELWSRGYWRDYLGGAGGRIGWAVQALCLRVPQRAFCFARLTAERLRAGGVRGAITVLEGEYAGSLEPRSPLPAEPLVVFAGRHIAEKRAPAVVPAVALARRSLPELRARVLGDGPERGAVLAAVAAHGLEDVIEVPGFVSTEEVEHDLARALCLLLPSSREGYGLVVVEASAAATPAVLVRGEDNAATELVEEGVNGFVAPSASPEDLAEAILRVQEAGTSLRTSTSHWFARNARRLSIDSSLDVVAGSYDAAASARS